MMVAGGSSSGFSWICLVVVDIENLLPSVYDSKCISNYRMPRKRDHVEAKFK